MNLDYYIVIHLSRMTKHSVWTGSDWSHDLREAKQYSYADAGNVVWNTLYKTEKEPKEGSLIVRPKNLFSLPEWEKANEKVFSSNNR